MIKTIQTVISDPVICEGVMAIGVWTFRLDPSLTGQIKAELGKALSEARAGAAKDITLFELEMLRQEAEAIYKRVRQSSENVLQSDTSHLKT